MMLCMHFNAEHFLKPFFGTAICDCYGNLCVRWVIVYEKPDHLLEIRGKKSNNDQTKLRMDLSICVDHEIMYNAHDRVEK